MQNKISILLSLLFASSGFTQNIECRNRTMDKDEQMRVEIAADYSKATLHVEGTSIELDCAGNLSYAVACRSPVSDAIYDIAIHKSTNQNIEGTVELTAHHHGNRITLLLGKIFCTQQIT